MCLYMGARGRRGLLKNGENRPYVINEWSLIIFMQRQMFFSLLISIFFCTGLEETLRKHWDFLRSQWLIRYKSHIENRGESDTPMLKAEYFEKMKFLRKVLPYWEMTLIGGCQKPASVQAIPKTESGDQSSTPYQVTNVSIIKPATLDVKEIKPVVSDAKEPKSVVSDAKEPKPVAASDVKEPKLSVSASAPSEPETKSVSKKPTSPNAAKTSPTKADLLRSWEESASSLNPHMSFFAGIVPALENFNQDQIIEFQMTVLRTIQNMRRRAGAKSAAKPRTTVKKNGAASATSKQTSTAGKREQSHSWSVQLKKKRRK